MKTCTKCSEQKMLSEFKKDSSKKDGLSSSCKQCFKAAWKNNYQNIAEKHRLKSKKYASENKEKISQYHKDWYKENTESEKQRTKKWRQENNGWANFLRTNSKPRYKKAIPSWADHEKMKAFYVEADRLSSETGIKYSVDHIVPIKGKFVSGLHVEYNLQVIKLTDNIIKHNHFPNYSKEVLT